MIRQTLPLLLVLFITTIYRLFILTNSSLTFFSDDAIYASLARFWIEKDFEYVFHPTWQPLYPLFSAIIYLFINSWEVALRITSLIAGEIMLIPLFFLVKKSLSTKEAVIFIFILGFFTPFIYASLFPLSDQLSATLIIAGLVTVFFALTTTRNSLFFLSSIFFALSYLTRSEGSLFFMLSIIFITGFLIWKVIFLKIPLKTILLIPLVLLIFLSVISPYAISIKNKLGFWTLSAKFSAQIQQGQAFALKANTTWSQEVVSIKSPNYKSKYFYGGIDHILVKINVLSRLFLEKAEIWRKQFLKIFPAWSIFFIILGVFYALSNKGFLAHLYLIFVMSTAIPITIFSTAAANIRYLLWTIPLLFYFFYLGVYYLSQNLLPHHKLIAFLALFLSLFLSAISLNDILNPYAYAQKFTQKHFRPQFIQASQWLKLNSKKEVKIMSRHEMFEFYSGLETIYMPQIPLPELIEYAKNHQTTYIIAWNGVLVTDDHLSDLAQEDFKTLALTKVYFSNTPEGNLIIYALNPNFD